MEKITKKIDSINVKISIKNITNCIDYNLDSILIEHGHNMHYDGVPLMRNWKEVYEYVTGE